MRALLILKIILFMATLDLAAQVPCDSAKGILVNERGDSIRTQVEKMPYVQEGFESYNAWIKSNMDQKLIAKKKRDKKKVYIGLVVHEDGSTSDFVIDKRAGSPYDKEAMRLVMQNPQVWVAGQCGEKKVKTRIRIPVQF